MALSYDEFWQRLSGAYPISKGELRLPINSELIRVAGLSAETLLAPLKVILEDLIATVQAREYRDIARQHGDTEIVPLLEGHFSGVVRIDCVVTTSGELKILEVNTDYPDGLLLHDHTHSLLSGMSEQTHLDALAKLLNPDESILILYPEDIFFKDAYYAEYHALQKLGFNCHIGTPQDVRIVDGQVFCGDARIDCIRRCMEVGRFKKTFLQQLGAAKVKFLNTFDLKIIGYKSLLEEVKSPLVPQTFQLTTETKAAVIAAKDHYVIKPAGLFEGQGIYIGLDTTQATWAQAVQTAADTGYVAQEYVAVQKIRTNMYDEGGTVTDNFYFDICPHFFIKDGKVIHEGLVLTRFSKQKIMNVALGGGIGYLHLEE